MITTKRQFLIGGIAFCGTGLTMLALGSSTRAIAAAHFEIMHTDAEWKRMLAPATYTVMRQEGTEPPYTSALLHEHRKGVFICAACALPLFASSTKFESGTGWPSFFQPLPKAVATTSDRSLLMERTEVHCRRCGGHLGHVFDDGPKPTGLRYCMNGVALKFTGA
jgi:peptide-methionine (R)-S-oxide reductase